MIGKLTGIVSHKGDEAAIIDVSGVGYLVYCSKASMQHLKEGNKVSLSIETQVREQDISLFGFADSPEQEWFKYLILVQGVGAKLALTILGALELDVLRSAILTQDTSALQQVSGVGAKIASRIINELKGKIKIQGYQAPLKTKLVYQELETSRILSDALDALINLGFNRNEAWKRISEIHSGKPDITLEELIRNALNKGWK